MPTREPLEQISEEAGNPTIDRAEFDAVMKTLIHSKPISKDGISAKIKREGRVVSRAEKRYRTGQLPISSLRGFDGKRTKRSDS